MGNQLLNHYEAETASAAEGGPYLKWRCVPARHRERRSESVTLFVFEKSFLDALTYEHDRQAILEILRKDSHNLQKLRHPFILPLTEPLLEDKMSLAFATKPVTQTLAGLIADNASVSHGTDGQSESSRIPLAMRSGIIDVAEALTFLHYDAKLAHLNISPTSIFISPQGRWYLGGLGYARTVETDVYHGQAPCDFRFDGRWSLSTKRSFSADPCLSYCAPEVTAPDSPTMGWSSDLFSLGLIIAQLAVRSVRPMTLLSDMKARDRAEHYWQAKRASTIVRSLNLPPDISSLLTKVLSPAPSARGDIRAVLEAPFLNDINVRALRFIDTIHEKNEVQQIQFLTGFQTLMANEQNEFCQNLDLLRHRVVPALTNLLSLSHLHPALLPTYFLIIQKVCTPTEFQSLIWPKFRVLLTAREIQVDAVVLIISELDGLIRLSTDEMVQQDFLPFVLKCSEIPEFSIQYRLLESIAIVAKRFDYATLRSSVLPRLLSLLVDSQSSSKIRIRALSVLEQIASQFDRATVTEQVVATLEKVSQCDKTSSVIIACTKTLSGLADLLGVKLTATYVLPVLSRLLVEENLEASHFIQVLQIFKHLVSRVEEHQLRNYRNQAESVASVQSVLRAAPAGCTLDTHSLERMVLTTPMAPPPPSVDTSGLTMLGAVVSSPRKGVPQPSPAPSLGPHPGLPDLFGDLLASSSGKALTPSSLNASYPPSHHHPSSQRPPSHAALFTPVVATSSTASRSEGNITNHNLLDLSCTTASSNRPSPRPRVLLPFTTHQGTASVELNSIFESHAQQQFQEFADPFAGLNPVHGVTSLPPGQMNSIAPINPLPGPPSPYKSTNSFSNTSTPTAHAHDPFRSLYSL